MNIVLSPETQRLLEAQMKRGDFANPDEAVQLALRTLETAQRIDYEDLDQQTRAGIDEAEAQYQRGEGRPWEEVREELRARFIKK